jgi:hypothetical protein
MRETVLENCPLCKRPMHFPSRHHLLPVSRGGKVIENICRDCHDTIHATYDNQQLELLGLTTVEALLTDEILGKTFRYLAKQPPTKRQKTKTPARQMILTIILLNIFKRRFILPPFADYFIKG